MTPPAGTLSVLVPAYNEVDLLPTTLARVLAAPSHGYQKEVIVIDDGSTDGTRDYLTELQRCWKTQLPRVAERLGLEILPEVIKFGRLVVLHNPSNCGKGASLRRAIDVATGDLTVTQDADLEYDPVHFEHLMAPVLDGHADAVFGSRFLGAGARRVLYFRHAIANRLLTLLSNLFTDLNLTDVLTGYKLVRTDLLKSVYLVSDRFGIEPELTAKLARLGARIYEVPIGYHGRTYDEGKKVTWRDGVAALWHIVRFNLVPGTYCRDAGHETLRNLGAVAGFNRHMYRAIAPHLGKRVLEVGAGIGNLTIHLARGRDVLATELDIGYVDTLRHRFRDRVSVNVDVWDVREPFRRPETNFDSVVCLNVLEHVVDDDAALVNLRARLRPDGALVLLVPAHPALFSPLDEAVGHYRRYSRIQLERALVDAGYGIERLIAFNLWGLFGWWLNGVVLRRSRLPGEQLSLFGRLSGILTFFKRLLGPPFGLSWIAVARATSP